LYFGFWKFLNINDIFLGFEDSRITYPD